MNIDQLRCFRALALSEHLSNTADELHIAQATLSNRIHSLETELGYPLFTRRGRRMFINEYGRAFLNQTNNILSCLEAARSELADIAKKEQSRMTVSMPPLTSFPGLYEKINNKCPETALETEYYCGSDLKRQLLSEQIAFAVTGVPIEHEEIETTLLSEDELVLVLNRKHPLADTGYAPLKNFAEEQFCDYAGAEVGGSNLIRYCDAAGFKVQIRFYAHSIFDVFSTVAHSDTVGMAPLRVFDIYANALPVCCIKLTEPRCLTRLHLQRKKNSKETSAVRSVRNCFEEYFKIIEMT